MLVCRQPRTRKLLLTCTLRLRKIAFMNEAAEIKAIRSEMGLTQTEFGKLLGRSGTAVSRWEDGKQLSKAVVMAARYVLDQHRNAAA